MRSENARAELEAILDADAVMRRVLTRGPELDLPNWYIGAGAVAGAVWNALHGFEPGSHIRDIDLVYHDPSDLSSDAEDRVAALASRLFAGIRIPIEVKNEARVHLWYERRFGRPISPHRSVEDAIDTWPTTATSIGVRREPGPRLVVYAPFGLSDVFDMLVRPNKALVSREVYDAKAERWKACWPKLTIVPWD